MSCDSCEEINPCSSCNDCDAEVVPCTTPPYVQTGCPTLSSFKCSEYTGVGKPCLGILTGDNGDEVIDKIADIVCEFVSGDKYAKISSTDTTTGYLSDKIKAKVSSALTRTIKNPGGVEYIEFDIDVPSILAQVPTPQDKFTKVSSTDTTSNYLFSKVEQGSYILVTRANSGGDEKLHIALDYNGLVTALNIIPDSFKFKISNTDTTEDFFSSKVITDAGSGILLNPIAPSGNAKIKFALDYTAIHNQLGLDNINVPLSLSSPNSTINIGQSGASNHTATLDAKISSQAGNQLVNNAGLYVPTPTPFTETTLVANDSTSIDFTQGGTNGHTVTAAAKISPTTGNILTILSNGMFVPNKTSSNGITQTSNNFKLGGDITDDTSLNLLDIANNALTFASAFVNNYIKLYKKEVNIVNSQDGVKLSTYRGNGQYATTTLYSRTDQSTAEALGNGFYSRAVIRANFDSQTPSDSGVITIGVHYPESSDSVAYPYPALDINKTGYIQIYENPSDSNSSNIDYYSKYHTFTGSVGLGSSPESGYKLKVSGNVKITGKLVSTPQALTYGATTTWNLDSGENASLTLTGNTTLLITNAVAGTYGMLVVKQDATGNRTLTPPAGSKVSNAGSGVISLSTAANAIDLIAFYYDGTNYFWKKESNFT